MKKDIHPKNYRLVVFQDMSCDYSFLTRSTVKTNDTIKWTDGKEYPLYKLEISDKSHPYFTGKQNLVDSAGRIEKFNKKYKIKTTTKENTENKDVIETQQEASTEEITAKENTTKEDVASKDNKN